MKKYLIIPSRVKFKLVRKGAQKATKLFDNKYEAIIYCVENNLSFNLMGKAGVVIYSYNTTQL